jgi:uncharacterized metal-binding protein
MNCSNCNKHICYEGKGCSQGFDFQEYISNSRVEYEKHDNSKILNVSSQVESDHYMKGTRLEEIMDFARLMNYKTIGIAHCIGLMNETKQLKLYLEKKFVVHSVCCKFSGIDKKDFNVSQIRHDRYEAICNPVGQAMVLNELKTDMNMIVGLCVGHDMLFSKYSNAPVTTFIVKDRVTGHNPAATVYSDYYKRKLS